MDWASILPDNETILKYIVEPDDREAELLSRMRQPDDLESILKAHGTEISSRQPDQKASDMFQEFLEQIIEEEKQVRIAYYEPSPASTDSGEATRNLYMIEDEESDFSYLFIPRGVTVQSVPQDVLGANVLGRTWLGTGYIEILDTLYGDAFQEVLLHELNHLLYPHENEGEIRNRTRMQLSYPIFH